MKEFIEKLIGRLEECTSIEDYGEIFISLDEIYEIVNELAGEYNNGWIPCSGRLPSKEEYLKDDGRFIVTDGNRRYQSIYDIYQGGFRTLKLFTNGGSERGWNFEEDNCVIAWQPLPAPYQPKGE